MFGLIIKIVCAWLTMNCMMIVLLAIAEKITIVYRKNIGLPTAKDDGQARYIQLSEYRINRKRRIKTDATYWLYDNIKGTVMENKVVDFNIDGNGFVEPSGNINSSYKMIWGGDSTIEQAIVSSQNRFPHLVEQKLRSDGYDAASFNAGYSGGNMFEINLLLLCKFLPLNPTHIFVCSNIHDISTFLQNDNYAEPFIT